MNERIALSSEALRAGLSSGDLAMALLCRELRVHDLIEVGDCDALIREIEAQVRDAQRLCQPCGSGR